MPLDDESAAQIQAFVSWASSKGYHVIGALISPNVKPNVRVFATSPDGELLKQKANMLRLMKVLNYSVNHSEDAEVSNLPLGLI